MLALVTNRKKPRAEWIKAHFGWTLKHPGRKQQVALVCTGDQGTGKTFLCTTFAQAVFGRYAGTASVRALSGQFYIAGYLDKLWVSHDEFVSNFENAEILKTLIRGTRGFGRDQGPGHQELHHLRPPGLHLERSQPWDLERPRRSRIVPGDLDLAHHRGHAAERIPRLAARREIKPFYEAYDQFLQRDDVRQAYVRILMDHAPSKMSEVEDLTHSAMRDVEVARKHLTDKQLVAKAILEDGVIHSGHDIAMPFEMQDLSQRVVAVVKDMGLRRINAEDILSEYIDAGIIERPADGKPYLFKYKIGALQRLYGDYLGVPLHSRWHLDINDDMPNDYQVGDPITAWKGRDK